VGRFWPLVAVVHIHQVCWWSAKTWQPGMIPTAGAGCRMCAARVFRIAIPSVSPRQLIVQVNCPKSVTYCEIPCPEILIFAPDYRSRRAWTNRHISLQSPLKVIALQRVVLGRQGRVDRKVCTDKVLAFSLPLALLHMHAVLAGRRKHVIYPRSLCLLEPTILQCCSAALH
jgi:hypothetical protein